MKNLKIEYIWASLRIFMGWIFFWAFIDKLWGFGFTTKSEGAWLAGGSPTMGFLKFGTKGPFAELFSALAGNVFVDWLFMVVLLGIGLSLLLGVGMKIASYSGALLLFLMYLAGFIPPEHNPVIDDHLVYALVLLMFPMMGAGRYWGFGNWWSNIAIVQKYKFLE